jgi:holliday junction DNA helicase RuvB
MERIFNQEIQESEQGHEVKLRPQNFSEFIGQRQVVENISVMVKSAQLRHEAMDHVLLSGPPGLGKTSLAMIIAEALGSQLYVISGPAIERKGDLAAIITNLQERDVLFIDEIHRMPISVEEILYSAMEDFRLDIVLGQGPAARTMQIDIPPFTLIGATTRSGLLSSPLRDRFMANLHFTFYEENDLAVILKNNAKKLQIQITPDALHEIARRSRGTPRIALRILRRVRDFALVHQHAQVEQVDVMKCLSMMQIDAFGLDEMDRRILTVIQEYYEGGPVGIEALCATLGEDRGTIEDVYEPYLLQNGFLTRTARGRMLSQKSKDHLLRE